MGQRRYPPLSPGEVVAILISLGFTFRGQEGSHAHYERKADDLIPRSVVTVDMAERDFGEFLMQNMIRQSNHLRDRFYGATKRSAKKASVRFIPSGGASAL